MRQPVVAGNWKMNLRAHEATGLVRDLTARLGAAREVEVILAPSFTVLPVVGPAVLKAGLKLAGQNVCAMGRGAFTGEVSAAMLKDVGCGHAIIGHSERRRLFGETDADIRGKIRCALDNGLGPILCVGETVDERERGETETVVERQMEQGLANVSADEMTGFLIAYEPVWSIGTGRNATPAQAQAVHRHLRSRLAGLFGPGAARAVRVLYGGSVNASNAGALLAEEDIDGALVGNASLNVDSFYAIINAANERLQGRD